MPGALAKVLSAYEHRALDDALEQLIRAHGKQAVRTRAWELTKSKPGRKPDPDWKVLWPIIQEDAELWLHEHETALAKRTNYKMAQAFAAEFPGHSALSTHRRIMGKLAKKRRIFMLIAAEHQSRSDFPFNAHLRALEALAKCGRHEVWDAMLGRARAELDQYRERYADPDPTLSFAAIEEANRNFFLSPPSGLAGLLGALGNLSR